MYRELLYVLIIILALFIAFKCINTLLKIILPFMSLRHGTEHIVSGGSSTLKQLITDNSKKYTHQDLYVKMLLADSKKTFDPIETIDSLPDNLPYMSSSGLIKPQIHIGQRKLFLNELQFLTYVRDKVNNHPKYCVYVGAAPGNKTHYLSQLFPNIKFILIDPNKFSLVISDAKASPRDVSKSALLTHRDRPHDDIVHIYAGYPTRSNKFINKKLINMTASEKKKAKKFIKSSDHKIYIIEDYMDDGYADFLSDIETIFITDMRSDVTGNRLPANYDIYWNTSMFFNWISVMRPVMTMFKFRIPFEGSDFDILPNDDFKKSLAFGIDFEKDMKEHTYHLPKSTLYIQPWAGRSSNELRAWIKQEDLTNIIKYDIQKIDNQIFYYNTINRGMCKHKNPNMSRKIGFCYCNDCALENKIWTDYHRPTGGNIRTKIHNSVVHLGHITSGRLLSLIHTVNLFDHMTAKDFMIFVKEDEKTTSKYRYIFKPKKKSSRGDAGKR